jgi:hypothetical protein
MSNLRKTYELYICWELYEYEDETETPELTKIYDVSDEGAWEQAKEEIIALDIPEDDIKGHVESGTIRLTEIKSRSVDYIG